VNEEEYVNHVLDGIMANAIRWTHGNLNGDDFVEQTRGMLKALVSVVRTSASTMIKEERK